MRGNASVSQSNAFAANTTAQAVANQITSMVTSQERRAKKKTWRSKLRKWSYKNGRSGCTIEED
jgi:cell division septum initiation protein DivIVA